MGWRTRLDDTPADAVLLPAKFTTPILILVVARRKLRCAVKSLNEPLMVLKLARSPDSYRDYWLDG